MNDLEKDDPLGLDEAEGRLLDYLLGQVSDDERARLEAELAENALLRVRLYDMRGLVDRVQAARPAPVDANVVAGVLDEICDDEAARRVIQFPWRGVLALAASLAIVAGVCAVALRGAMELPALVAIEEEPVVAPQEVVIEAPPVITPVQVAVVLAPQPASSVPTTEAAPLPAPAAAAVPQSDAEWLVAAQDADGSWNPSRWGGVAQFRDGVTALALCALLRSSEQPFGGANAAAATRAVEYIAAEMGQLVRIQRLDPVRAHDMVFMRAALAEARPHCDQRLQGVIDGALAAGRGIPDATVEALESHLPASAERLGGRVYAVARAVLLGSRS